VLFPALRSQPPDLRRISQELVTMHGEHLELGAQLRQLRASSDAHIVEDGMRSGHRQLKRAIAELELDTMRHIHIETYVLMRRFAAESEARRTAVGR
jgi:iron-sulfur cluster repair protein YtfE (RIC family)